MRAAVVLQHLHYSIVIVIGTLGCSHLQAQEFSLNYERLSSLEDPLATEIGDMTLVFTGLMDAPLSVDMEDDNDTHTDFVSNFEFSARVQLPNRWRMVMTYFSQYVTEQSLSAGMDEEFTDNFALSVGSSWGTLLVGNLSGVVREQVRRLRSAGNAELAFDDSYGKLEDDGGGYLVRFGPWVFNIVVDQNESFDVGALFQRPIDDRDYRLSIRYTDSTYTTDSFSREFSSKALIGVGELIYGSTLWDIGSGFERLKAGNIEVDRWYVSAGGRIKKGVFTLSLEGHYGEIESEDEVSAALGVQYDLARGLSANLGFNYADARVHHKGVSLMDTKYKIAILSIRYSF